MDRPWLLSLSGDGDDGRFVSNPRWKLHGLVVFCFKNMVSSNILQNLDVFFGILQRFLHFDVLLENHLNFDGSAIVHFMMDLDLPA